MEQTKKSFKWTNLFYLLLILPLMFVFAACGGDQATKQLQTEATCNTSGDYATASDKAAYTTAVGTQTAFDASGYRLTGKIAIVTGEGENQVKTDFMYMNLIVKEIKNGDQVDYQAAMKMKMIDMEGPTAQATEPKYIEAYGYYKDGKTYSEEDGNKYYEEVNFADILDGFDFVSCQNLEDLLGFVGAANDVEVTKQGDNFKIVTNSALTPEPGVQINAEATAYLNFKDGKVVAAQLNYLMTVPIFGKMDCQFTISGFDGNIAFPNLSGYTKAPEDALI